MECHLQKYSMGGVNSLCHMSIFIQVASKNDGGMPKSTYNMGNITSYA